MPHPSSDPPKRPTNSRVAEEGSRPQPCGKNGLDRDTEGPENDDGDWSGCAHDGVGDDG